MDGQERVRAFLENPSIKLARGKNELKKHALDGERLTQRQAIYAKCYDCMGGYSDGKYSCGIPTCPLYPFMPYNNVEPKA